MELDAQGRVARTWRGDDLPLTVCIQAKFDGVLLSVPPRAPFFTFLAIDIDVVVDG